ncbi:MAG: MerR family transcriptional regulator [Mucilaginibacter sp.]
MQYSISDLEQLSGVSVHNIRIWERRYNALQPSRTTGNTRFYNDDQLKKLLNIAGLYYSGHKISKACAMGEEETAAYLQQEIDLTIAQESRYEYYITQIINNSLQYDEPQVNQLIAKCFGQNGILKTYKFVLYPLLVRLGLMWRKESLCPSQEHFLSSIIRQKLFAAIDGCGASERSSNSWLLFLPEDEDHDIGLLLANYLLRSSGNKVIYLGPKVPLFALGNTITATNPANLLLFMTRVRPLNDAQDYIDQLAAGFPEQLIYISGNPRLLSELKFPERVKWVQGIHDFENILNPQS